MDDLGLAEAVDGFGESVVVAVAEAIRLYMANPSYLKEVAPKTAAAIRQAVNRNPETARIIQFNSGGVPGVIPLSDEDWDLWVVRGGIQEAGQQENLQTPLRWVAAKEYPADLRRVRAKG